MLVIAMHPVLHKLLVWFSRLLLTGIILLILFVIDGNLAEMLKDEGGLELPLPQDQSLYYLQQILEGVNYVHQSGYLHLDINSKIICE